MPVKCCGEMFFFFKPKTAYEMRISDWSSDVCSSDLPPRRLAMAELQQEGGNLLARRFASEQHHLVLRRRQLAGGHDQQAPLQLGQLDEDRKSVVEGKSVSVRVDLGGRRIIKKKTN